MRIFPYSFKSDEVLRIDGRSLKIEDVVAVARHRRRVEIAPDAAKRVIRCRAMVDQLLVWGSKVYGLTTGFGKLRDVAIPRERAEELQKNIIRSHACGVGEPFPEDVVRAAMLLRANTLCLGHSGIRLETLEQLVNMLNDDIYPYVPEKGSVGASGDLAPLSHLGLVVMGDAGGRIYPRSLRGDSTEVVTDARNKDFIAMPEEESPLSELRQKEGWTFRPITLKSKEGLALNNGTQFMTAIASLAVYDLFFTLRFSEAAAAMSLESQHGVRDAYRPEIHAVRPHAHQAETAARVMEYCAGSRILDLYLNTGHLFSARLQLEEAAEHLKQMEKELADRGADAVDSVCKLGEKVEKLDERIRALIPMNGGDVDTEQLTKWAKLSDRDQIAVFEKMLTPYRHETLDLLHTADGELFPEAPAAVKVRNSLTSALKHITKAVPDTPHVQDDYSFRCFPQVQGCTERALWSAAETVETELNSATDNPLLFPPDPGENAGLETAQDYQDWLKAKPERRAACHNSVLSGGNFHGQPIALAMDCLGIAAAEIGSISERRVAHLVDESMSEGLPPFLIRDSGLNSGFMIPQYTAAALVSENKVLAHPAGVDSIPTSAGAEDHVSMGTIAARKAAQIIDNVQTVVAIEMLTAFQALKFREPLMPGHRIRRIVERLRENGVERYVRDRVMYPEIQKVADLIRGRLIDDCLLFETHDES